MSTPTPSLNGTLHFIFEFQDGHFLLRMLVDRQVPAEKEQAVGGDVLGGVEIAIDGCAALWI